MTAPDVNADVRARFEAWAVSRGMNVSREAPNLGLPTDCYWDDATESAWQAYRAAHADLSWEVRELRRLLAVAWACATLYTDDGELSDASAHPPIDFLRDSAAEIRRKLSERTFAPFSDHHPTHQEKP